MHRLSYETVSSSDLKASELSIAGTLGEYIPRFLIISSGEVIASICAVHEATHLSIYLVEVQEGSQLKTHHRRIDHAAGRTCGSMSLSFGFRLPALTFCSKCFFMTIIWESHNE